MKIINLTKTCINEFILPFITCWFLLSLFVDIIAVPTIFRNMSNIEEGGRIGMIIFGRFNFLEVFFGLMIVLGLFLQNQKTKSGLVLKILGIILLGFSFIYAFYMTPIIGETSVKIHQLNPLDPLYMALKNKHNDYHSLYRNLDSIKLLILLFLGGGVLKMKLEILGSKIK